MISKDFLMIVLERAVPVEKKAVQGRWKVSFLSLADPSLQPQITS